MVFHLLGNHIAKMRIVYARDGIKIQAKRKATEEEGKAAWRRMVGHH